MLFLQKEVLSKIHHDVRNKGQENDHRPIESEQDYKDSSNEDHSKEGYTLLVNRGAGLDVLLEFHREHRNLADKQKRQDDRSYRYEEPCCCPRDESWRVLPSEEKALIKTI